MNASYPQLCSTRTETNKVTGKEYQLKILDVQAVQTMLIDALIEKVQRLEYAISQIIGDSKMW